MHYSEIIVQFDEIVSVKVSNKDIFISGFKCDEMVHKVISYKHKLVAKKVAKLLLFFIGIR